MLTRRGREVFRFDVDGKLTSVSDLSGNTTTLSYAGAELATVTDASGRALVFTWTAGKITKVTAPSTNLRSSGPTEVIEVSYGYTGSDLTSVTSPDGAVWTFGYDGSHRMAAVREPRHQPSGPVVENGYDGGTGRLLWQDDELNRRTLFAYEPGRTTVTDPAGRVVLYEHRNGICTGIVRDPGPHESRWSFDVDPGSLGRTKTVDPNGIVTTASFDDHGRPIKITTPKGTTEITYDAATGQVRSVKDPAGVTTTYSYEPGTDLLTGVSRPIIPGAGTWSVTIAYADVNNPGSPTAVTDARGKVWSFAYSSSGDLAAATTPTGEITTWTYNAHGWPLTAVAPAGNAPGGVPGDHTTSYEYNPAGEVVKAVDPLGAATEYGFDLSGYLAWVRDPVPVGDPVEQTGLSWNAAGELVSVQRADGSSVATEYWPDGLVKAQVDGAGAVTGYGYDAQGRLSTVTDPAGRTTTYRHDPAGRVMSKERPGGSCLAAIKVGCITYSYFPGGELEDVDYSDQGTSDVSFTYDELGRRVSMTDQAGTSSFTWDSIGRLLSSVDPVAGAVTYGYSDPGPQATSITYPGGKSVSRTFDDAGRQSSLGGWVGGTTVFGYSANGDLAAIDTTAAPGVEGSYGFDRAGRMTGSTLRKDAVDLAGLAFVRDPEGMVVTVSGSGVVSAADAYTYTGIDALSSDATGSYSYDSAGNLTGFPDGRRQRFNAANELCYQATDNTAPCTSAPAGAITFDYDNQGNRSSRTGPSGILRQHRYDQAGRLTTVGVPGALATIPVMGDWNGDGIDTPGAWNPQTYAFTARDDFGQGPPTYFATIGTTNDVPLSGDWNGDGIDTIGVHRPGSSTFYLRNTFSTGPSDIVHHFGTAGDRPLVGDWDGDGDDTIGVHRGNNFWARNDFAGGAPQLSAVFGQTTDTPLTGDWDGDGDDTIGVYRPGGRQFFNNEFESGTVDQTATYGALGDKPLIGDWNGNGRDTIGVYRPSSGDYYLRNSFTNGPGEISTRLPDAHRYTYTGDGLRRTKTTADGTTTSYTWDRTPALPLLAAETMDAARDQQRPHHPLPLRPSRARAR